MFQSTQRVTFDWVGAWHGPYLCPKSRQEHVNDNQSQSDIDMQNNNDVSFLLTYISFEPVMEVDKMSNHLQQIFISDIAYLSII